MKKIVLLFTLLSHFSFAQTGTLELNTPGDFDTIRSTYPLFSWYMTGVDISSPRVNIRLTIVELNENQTAGNGLVMNTAVHIAENIKSTNYSYPFGSYEFQIGKKYGWNVQVFNSGMKVMESAPYTFVLPNQTEVLNFATLASKLSGNVYEAINGMLYFTYPIKNSGDYSVIVINTEGKEIDIPIKDINSNVVTNGALSFDQSGANFYALLLPSQLTKGVYQLKIIDPNGKMSQLKFQLN